MERNAGEERIKREADLQMSENVWQALNGNAPSLAHKLETNVDLSNTIMAILGSLIVLAHEQNVPFEGITFDALSESHGVFKSQLRFSTLNVGTITQPATRSDFMEYARARSHNLARALERSPRLRTFFEDLVDALDKYAIEKNIPFETLKISKRIVTPDNILVFKVGRDAHGE